MRHGNVAVSAGAGLLLCVPVAAGPLVQIHHFATGFNNSGTPLTIPAIDPAGIGWHAPSGHLFIADSEIEEVSQAWSLIHKNIFEVSPSGGTLYASYDLTILGNSEPTGITFNTADGFFYVTNDDSHTVTRYSFSPGSGFMVNDTVSTSSTAGSLDPEGITCDPATGRIYVVDGHDELIVVYRYQGGDFVLQDLLDLNALNSSSDVASDPEGIAFDDCSGHLFVVSDPDSRVYEYTTAGIYVASYSLSNLSPGVIAPQGLTFGPTSSSSDDPSTRALYIADGGIDNNDNSSERDGDIYETAATCTGGPGPGPITDCNGNGIDDPLDIGSGFSQDCNGNGVPDECEAGCGPGQTILVSFTSSVTLPGVGSVADEDIAAYNTGSGTWSMYFDGSDVGAGSFKVNALAVLPGGDLLISFTSAGTIAGISADDSDILRFHPTSLGSTTAGTWSLYFDGSDVGLTTNSEKIDALAIAPDGRLLISTTGSPSVPGLSSTKDEDLLAFAPTSLGPNTAGTWSWYVDGSDVGLADSGSEDVDAASVGADGRILLSTTGSFSVPGASGADEDIVRFTPTSLGSSTSGTYAMWLVGSTAGVPSSADISAIELLP